MHTQSLHFEGGVKVCAVEVFLGYTGKFLLIREKLISPYENSIVNFVNPPLTSFGNAVPTTHSAAVWDPMVCWQRMTRDEQKG